MSCDWDVYCLDCESQMGLSDLNHKDELILNIVKRAGKFADLAEAQRDCELRVMILYDDKPLDLQWFAKHRGHRLAPISEYGEVLGDCGEYFQCGECGDRKLCHRPKGHEGSHHWKRDDEKSGI